MSIQLLETILYVADQNRSRDFYRAVLLIEPTLDVPGMTEFTIGGSVLGLMPATGIKRLLGDAIEDPASARSVPRVELYLRVDDPAAYAERAIAAGARELSPLQMRNWGDEVVYLSDLDYHIIAFARSSGVAT
jgi:catechol 2,3-dioxygenase-like lactoylglutathione lyase family enzyme